MIGNMISKIRKEKGITKTQLANETDINIGHLTHKDNDILISALKDIQSRGML